MRRAPAALFLAFAWVAAGPATAQTLDAPDTAAHRSAHLFRHRDLYIAAAFAAGAAAMAPLDRRLAHALQDSSVQANRLLSNGATGVKLLASPGSLLISGGMFAAGRAFRSPHVADAGLHIFESVLMAEATTGVVKNLTGRARPFANPREPFDYRFGSGFSDDQRRSMPSGHTSAAFAAAAAGTAEVGQWWPRRKTLAAATLYTAAGLVGASRMYNNKHWASDVVIGAGVGVFSGWKVVGYTHAHPDNPVDRVLLRTHVSSAPGGGVAIVWSSGAD